MASGLGWDVLLALMGTGIVGECSASTASSSCECLGTRDVARLFELLSEEKLDSRIDRQFPLEGANEALGKLKSGEVVLVPDGE